MTTRPTAVVTGAAQGIGAAIGRRFAAAGHRVIGVDLNSDRMAGTITTWQGSGHRSVRGDAASPEDVGRACDLAEGHLTTFVANAGFAKAGDSTDYSLDDWNAMLRVHLTGAMVGAQESGARMPDGGSIVMMSSLNGLLGFPRRTAYGAAKAGVAGLVRGLAAEWAPYGIRVNAIAPGSIVTELSQDFIRRGVIREQDFLDRIPMNRFGEPDEVAELAYFLGTPLSSYITGATVPIDGGWAARGIT
ncbi:SDR family oxidoreductase [Gordonia sp. HY002]|uniref:SDR family NAD(P)-dependent oxidoreductase n=1 Tax=Gordonia zhenghanii TaxID=2911516 RepID=UPI001EF0FEB8|nr:SDR family oxidoreductase [Gordonia zhenghanii]MCF8570209.1 SDR family oxidoreductase [Gordonia zhenghanii]MCF8608184.1 SDR family oxidoreductase [Gordonia zhenghanii]